MRDPDTPGRHEREGRHESDNYRSSPEVFIHRDGSGKIVLLEDTCPHGHKGVHWDGGTPLDPRFCAPPSFVHMVENPPDDLVPYSLGFRLKR